MTPKGTIESRTDWLIFYFPEVSSQTVNKTISSSSTPPATPPMMAPRFTEDVCDAFDVLVVSPTREVTTVVVATTDWNTESETKVDPPEVMVA